MIPSLLSRLGFFFIKKKDNQMYILSIIFILLILLPMITHDFGHTSEKRMTVSIIIGSIIIASSCIGIKIYQDSYPTHEEIATPNKKLQEKYYLNKNDKLIYNNKQCNDDYSVTYQNVDNPKIILETIKSTTIKNNNWNPFDATTTTETKIKKLILPKNHNFDNIIEITTIESDLIKKDQSKSSNFINDLNKSANNLNNAATEKKPDK